MKPEDPEEVREALREHGPLPRRRFGDDVTAGIVDDVREVNMRPSRLSPVGEPQPEPVWYLVMRHTDAKVLGAWLEHNEPVRERCKPQTVARLADERGLSVRPKEDIKPHFDEAAWADSYANGSTDGGSKAVYRAALEHGDS